MERGIVIPTVARLAELADIFGGNEADLLTEAGPRISDQAKYVGQLLAKLSGNDRTIRQALNGLTPFCSQCQYWSRTR